MGTATMPKHGGGKESLLTFLPPLILVNTIPAAFEAVAQRRPLGVVWCKHSTSITPAMPAG